MQCDAVCLFSSPFCGVRLASPPLSPSILQLLSRLSLCSCDWAVSPPLAHEVWVLFMSSSPDRTAVPCFERAGERDTYTPWQLRGSGAGHLTSMARCNQPG